LIYFLANWSLRSLRLDVGPFTTAYLLLDLLALVGALAAWCLYGLSWNSLTVFVLVLYALLVSLTDFRFQVIPDRLTLPGIALGLILAGLTDYIGLWDAVLGGAVGIGLFYLMAVLGGKLLKKPSMGGGDIKLATGIGILLGWQKLMLVVFLASILGLIYALCRRPLTWIGPFLIYAVLIVFVVGDKFMETAFFQHMGLVLPDPTRISGSLLASGMARGRTNDTVGQRSIFGPPK
jgi:leader peptidase (prepilin peptidase)/N-methyltransferase